MKNKMSGLSRVFLILAAILLVISIFVPLWQIDLDAPQYPEGLCLKIHVDKLAGDVDIINGLNHYIGMKTLHTNDFIEFSILKYIIYFFASFSLVVAIFGSKKSLYFLLSLFILFGIVAMVDFWRWEYNYGHELDPNAAIIVPGMAYQPPLIGFKQLLNFGAFSVPDTGGWLFIGSGLLMLTAVFYEYTRLRRAKKNNAKLAGVGALGFLFLFSCTNKQVQTIKLNSDKCDYCKMTISDARFMSELITAKSRVYKFDDVTCMMGFTKENAEKVNKADFYVADFLSPNNLTPVNTLHFLESVDLGSPMGGNIAAFIDLDSLNHYKSKLNGSTLNWSAINH